jgi:hypothetical protein
MAASSVTTASGLSVAAETILMAEAELPILPSRKRVAKAASGDYEFMPVSDWPSATLAARWRWREVAKPFAQIPKKAIKSTAKIMEQRRNNMVVWFWILRNEREERGGCFIFYPCRREE